jgi:hypothetical protein
MVDGFERKDLRKDDDDGLCFGWYFLFVDEVEDGCGSGISVTD